MIYKAKKIIDFIRRKTTCLSADKEKEYMIESRNTLLQLTDNGHTYWKFSQSQRGRSEEHIYIEYKKNMITTAEDSEKKLSFVDERNILKCYMYGDLLTKFCFDRSNILFQTICNEEYRYIGGGLGEYESSKLLTEEIYSLQNIETIIMLFKLAENPHDVIYFFISFYGDNLEKRLRRYEYNETADFMKFLWERYRPETFERSKYVISNIDEIAYEYKVKT